MAFDPDKFLSETESPQKAQPDGAFNPDQFLAETGGALQVEPSKSMPYEPNDELAGKAIDAIAGIGRFLDRYSGAPTRAAVGKLQEDMTDIGGAGAAFVKQLGAEPELAPTGKEIATKAGLSTKPLSETFPGLYSETGEGLPLKKGGLFDVSPAGVGGVGVDVFADITNVVPFSAIGKGIARGAKFGAVKGTGAVLKGSAKAEELITGTRAIGGALDTAEDVAQSIKKTFSTKIAGDADKFINIAKKNNIDLDVLPESVLYGKESVISRASRAQAAGPLGQPRLEKFQEAVKQTSRAIDGNIAKIGGGSVLNAEDAGKLIREGYDNAVSRTFDNLDVTHNYIIKNQPGLMLSKEADKAISSTMDGIEKFAKGRAKRGITATQRGQAEQLLNAVEAYRSSNGSYKQSVEALRMIGEAAFQSKNSLADIPVDVQKLRDMYFSISDGLISTVRKDVSGDFAEELIRNNKAISEFYGNKSILAGSIGNKGLANERVFKNLVVNGDSKKIDALKSLLTPEEMQKLKGAYVNSLVKKGTDDTVNFLRLKNALDNRMPVTSNLLNKEEAESISELIALGDRFGRPVLSSSETGAANVFNDIMNTIKGSFANETIIKKLKASAKTPDELKIIKAVDSGDYGALEKIAKEVSARKEPQKSIANFFGILKAGPREKALKGAQVLGVQKTGKEKEKRLRQEAFQ